MVPEMFSGGPGMCRGGALGGPGGAFGAPWVVLGGAFGLPGLLERVLGGSLGTF